MGLRGSTALPPNRYFAVGYSLSPLRGWQSGLGAIETFGGQWAISPKTALVLVPWGINSANAYLTLADLAAKRLALEAKREKEDKEAE